MLDSHQAYFIITIITILCYIFLVLAVPKLVTPSISNSPILLFFVTGIISYGFQFELERGQYNVIVFLFCMLAIYIFHFHHEFRVFAYLLLTLAIQLKIYPVIFSLLFVKDWRDWRNNVRRMIGLGALNIAALFMLGYSVFVDFVGAIMSRSLGGSIRWIGNHSIQAFISFLSYNRRTPLDESAALWAQEHASLLAISLLLYFLVCFLSLIGIAYWRREKGLNANILMGCTIGAMVIPSVSHDYKLALLAAPMAIFFGNVVLQSQLYKKMLSYFLILAASVSYSATLYSFMYRPDYIANSMPLLFVILTVVTLLYIMKPSLAKDSDDLHELKSNVIVE